MLRKIPLCLFLFAVLCSHALADRIAPGTYYGDLYLTSDANLTEGSVTLAGIGQILDCQGRRLIASRNVNHAAINLEAKGITVRNCVITNRFASGIIARSMAIEFTITDNTISAGTGVRVLDVDSRRVPGNIRENKFIDNSSGVQIARSNNMRVIENDFTYSLFGGETGSAIFVEESQKVLARLNNISSIKTIRNGGSAIGFVDGSKNVARQNTITGARRTIGVRLHREVGSDVLENTITGIGSIGISVTSSTDSVIRGNIASGNGGRAPFPGDSTACGGIFLLSSDENDILENVTENNIAPDDRNCVGIYLVGSDENRVSDNISSSNEWGTYLSLSNDNFYEGNNISLNFLGNIGISNSTGNGFFD